MNFVESAALTVEHTLEGLSYFAAVVVMLFFGKFVYNKTTKFDFDNELTTKDNVAFATVLAGYIGGLAVALSGTLQATGQGVYSDWIGIGITGVIAIIFMRLSVLVNDKAILYKFNNDREITEDQNLGTGFVVAGGCLATGFMLAGTLTSNSLSFVDRIIDIGIYWSIGQTILIIGGIFFQWITKYDVHHELEHKDNAAVGLMFGGYLFALGLIANAALRGASSNIIAELPTIAIWTITGLFLLGAMKVITDKVFLPKSPLHVEVAEQQNIGAGGIAAAGFLSVALLFGASVNPTISGQSNIFETNVNHTSKIKLLKSDGKEKVIPLEKQSDQNSVPLGISGPLDSKPESEVKELETTVK